MSTVKVFARRARRPPGRRQIASGRYKNADAYLADLVERDREEAERHAALKAAIDDGLASGERDVSFEDIVEEARARHANG